MSPCPLEVSTPWPPAAVSQKVFLGLEMARKVLLVHPLASRQEDNVFLIL